MPRWIDLPSDDDVPEPGDLLVGTLTVWRIDNVRPIDSRLWPYRWGLRTTSLGRHHGDPPPAPPGRRRWHTQPYGPGEGPEDVFGPAHHHPR